MVPRSPALLAARASALSSALLAGCCCCPPDLFRMQPVDTGPEVELGNAMVPPTTADPPRRYGWSAPLLAPSRYAAGYALDRGESQRSMADFYAFAARFDARQLPNGNTVYHTTRDCPEPMYCVHRFVATRDRADLRPLALLFSARAQSTGMSIVGLADLIVTFTQNVDYRIPAEQPFGVLPPAVVATSGAGDCDSKAILALVLLQEVGIDAVLLASEAHEHAAVGIAVPVSGGGVFVAPGGGAYAYAEVTRPGWPIGQMPPDTISPNDWRVVDIRR